MTSSPMTIPSDIEQAITYMATSGASIEAMIAKMRAMGLSKPHSMMLLRNVTRIGLGEVKDLVHFSPTWTDRRISDEEFHEQLYQTALKMGFGEVESPALETVR